MMKNAVVTTNYHIKSKKIPSEFDGFTIAHISDSHARAVDGILDAVAAISPDIIVITGDMLHGTKLPTDKFDVFFDSLIKIAPVYMVTGNHDTEIPNYTEFFKRYTDSGAVLLDNSRVMFEKNGKKIALFGLSDPISKCRRIILNNIKKSYDELERFDGYEILLFHRANLLDCVKNLDFDLILSGHMHGGQLRLPYIGGVLSPSSSLFGGYRMLFPKYCYGKFTHKNTTMLVNAGMCNTLPIPRLGNPFEVGKIVLSH